MRYLTRIASALSQALNTVLLDGHPNESVSGRCHRERWKLAERVIDEIFFWQPNHCREAYMTDVEWARSYVIDYEYRQLQARRER